MNEDVKQLQVKVIPSAMANKFIKRVHYSGSVMSNSQLHFGVFWKGKLHGCMQYGCSIDKRKMLGLVKGATWDSFLELNRLAFDEYLPRNSESRALAISFRLIKRYAPTVKWIVSFADATQCGDGTIYRATGFKLTKIKKNDQIVLYKGRKVSRVTLDNTLPIVDGHYATYHIRRAGEFHPLPGYQIRYIYFIDKSWETRLVMPSIPYSKLTELNAHMYKGQHLPSIPPSKGEYLNNKK